MYSVNNIYISAVKRLITCKINVFVYITYICLYCVYLLWYMNTHMHVYISEKCCVYILKLFIYNIIYMNIYLYICSNTCKYFQNICCMWSLYIYIINIHSTLIYYVNKNVCRMRFVWQHYIYIIQRSILSKTIKCFLLFKGKRSETLSESVFLRVFVFQKRSQQRLRLSSDLPAISRKTFNISRSRMNVILMVSVRHVTANASQRSLTCLITNDMISKHFPGYFPWPR